MWSLPRDTFGESIYYVILGLPQVAECRVAALPCLLPMPEHDVTLRVVTVAIFKGQQFHSDPVDFVLRAQAMSKQVAVQSNHHQDPLQSPPRVSPQPHLQPAVSPMSISPKPESKEKE